jgi:hypothetical protein
MPFGGPLVDVFSPVELRLEVLRATGQLKFIQSRRIRTISGAEVRSKYLAASVAGN